MPKPGEKKAPPKTGKTDALRAQREAQHRELMEQRKLREREEARAPKKLPPLELEPLNIVDDRSPEQQADDGDTAVVPLESDCATTDAFGTWQEQCQAYVDKHPDLKRVGDIWTREGIDARARAAFAGGVSPKSFVNDEFEQELFNA